MITSLIPTRINVCSSKSGSLGTMIAVTIYKIPKPVEHLNKILENGFCVHKITRTTKNKITNVSSSTTSFKQAPHLSKIKKLNISMSYMKIHQSKKQSFLSQMAAATKDKPKII